MKPTHLPLLFFVFAAVVCSNCVWAVCDPEKDGHPESKGFNDYPIVEQLPLFEQIDVKGQRVSMWNRTYALDGKGLLQAIENGGRNILAGPMRITGKINGEDIALTPVRQKVLEQTFSKVRFRSESRQGKTGVAITTLIENDGMMRFVIDITSASDISFEDITVRLPLNNEHFKYIHYIAETRTKSDSLDLPQGSGLIWKSQDAQTRFVNEGTERKSDISGILRNANVRNSFLPLVWIGNGNSGLAWFAESDKGWQERNGSSVVELGRDNDVLEFKINIIAGQATRKQLTIDFGLHATPVKPLPARWRTWQHYNARGLHEGKWIERNLGEYENNIVHDFGEILMFDLDCIGLDLNHRFSRKITDPAKTRQYIKLCRDKGYKVFSYLTPYKIDHVEDYPDEWEEWMRVPKKTLKWKPKKDVVQDQPYLCHNAAGNMLHMLQYVEHLVTEYDIDGIYIDVPFFNGGCTAPGCCYEREDGTKQPIFKIHQMRAFYKKLAGIFVRHGKYPYLLVHNSTRFLIPAFSYCWAGKPGEFMAEVNYELNHNEFFRDHKAKAIVEFNPQPWGLVTFCMDDLKITRYQKLKSNQEFAGKEEFEAHVKPRYLGIPLLHDGLIMNWCSTPEYSYAIQKARSEFGIGENDVRFHPYWEPDTLKSGNLGVEMSYYTREKGVMLILVNFTDSDIDCSIKLNRDLLDRMGGAELIDPISGQRVVLENGTMKVSVPAQLHRMLMSIGK